MDLSEKKLPIICDMIKSFWIHNRANNVLDTLRKAPLLTRSYSTYGYTVHMNDVHLVKILLDMLFKMPFTPKTVHKLSVIYSEKIHHTFLPLFLHLYQRIPSELFYSIRDQLPPNTSYDDMITFLNSPYSQSIVLTSLVNNQIKRILEKYSSEERKEFYFLLDAFECTLGV